MDHSAKGDDIAQARPLRRPTPDDLEGGPSAAGARVADRLTRLLGSWRFILVQSGLLATWIVVNVAAWIGNWDPYPFILLNLALSFQAAYAAPIILMSQHRQAAKDRLTAEHDYRVDRLAEQEIEAIQERLDELAGRQWDALLHLQRRQLSLLRQIRALTGEVRAATAGNAPRIRGEPNATQSIRRRATPSET